MRGFAARPADDEDSRVDLELNLWVILRRAARHKLLT
jgi:hypothetical protein